MNNTAQDNNVNLSAPTFNDGSAQQPVNNQNPQPTKSISQDYGDFQGNIDTIPAGFVKDDLGDIIPSEKVPKAMQREEKENNLSQPLPTVVGPQDNQEQVLDQVVDSKIQGEQLPEEQKDTSVEKTQEVDNSTTNEKVIDLGNTPLPDNSNVQPDISMPAIEPLSTTQTETSQTSNEHDISQLFEYTIEKGASDLHISVGYPPIVRIDGELEKVDDNIVDPIEAEQLILPLLSDDKKELLEVNKEIDFAYTHEGKYVGRFRINAFYSMKTLSAAFRLIPDRIRTIEELKLPTLYHQFTGLKQGMILITGPTGHGKSTTLAAMLEDINRTRFCRVITIEDPIEYVFQGKKSLFDQREMGQDTHSWQIALKSAMREDPDVILVGEMRDYETISSAITLAETGHLVFATLHTNNASQSIDRMIDVFPEEQQAQVRSQLSNILEVVIAQRLIPLDRGGRRAVQEILMVNPAVKTMIREAKTHQVDNVIRTSSDVGMVSLERSLVDLIREGVINVSKAQEYALYPEEISRLLKS